MSKANIYQTAAYVTIFSVVEKFLGFLYRIVLSRTLGSEGVGLYQIALSVFAVLVTATSSGIPITVSRLITKHRAAKKQKSRALNRYRGNCQHAGIFRTGFFTAVFRTQLVRLSLFRSAVYDNLFNSSPQPHIQFDLCGYSRNVLGQ